MKELQFSELSMIQGGAFNFFSGGGTKGRWGSYGAITGGYTFNTRPNVSISPSVTVTKNPGENLKITGGGIGISIKF
ncbi:hypothetical protein [Ursidibacter arcticus]